MKKRRTLLRFFIIALIVLLSISLFIFTKNNVHRFKFKFAGWEQVDDSWRHYHKDGTFTKSAWEKLNGDWYYFDQNGLMVTGWYYINDNWYYMTTTGEMLNNTWIDGYYLGEDGSCTENGSLIYDNMHWQFCYVDGSYAKNKWVKINQKWYYFDANGYRVSNKWISNYYLLENGEMATNCTVDRLSFDANGDYSYILNGSFAKEGNIWFYYSFDEPPSKQNMDLSSVKSIARIGYNVYADDTPPEQSIASFQMAVDQGFSTVLCDLRFTKDNIPVCIHDETINSIAREPNGAALEKDIRVSDYTYEELCKYDFGIYKGTEYADTKLLTLKQMLAFCEKNDLELYIEVKDGTPQQLEASVQLATQYVIQISWAGFFEQLEIIKNSNEEARLGLMTEYITPETIQKLLLLQTQQNTLFFFVWEYTSLTEDLVNQLKSYNIAFEMGTLDDPYEIAKYWTGIYQYCSGIESNCIVANNINLDEIIFSQRNSSRGL